jgi:UTP--glucose-1-phosphate uridylyltransferase
MKSKELVSKIVVPIAGLGTRMLPATKAIPKEMLPIVNKPIIQIIIEEIIQAGFKEVIFITHSSKSAVENHFDESFELESTLEKRIKRALLKEIKSISNLKISIQSIRQGQAKGLGHAILCAKKIIKNEPFGIVLPDMVLNKTTKTNNLARLKQDFDSTGVSQILLGKTTKKEISNYGVVKTQKTQIEKIIEKPSPHNAPSNLFVVGRYIFNNNLFKYLSNLKPSKSGELELTDAIQKYIEDSQPIFYSHLEGKFYDCGNKLGYLKAIVDFALEDKSITRDFKSFIRKTI